MGGGAVFLVCSDHVASLNGQIYQTSTRARRPYQVIKVEVDGVIKPGKHHYESDCEVELKTSGHGRAERAARMFT